MRPVAVLEASNPEQCHQALRDAQGPVLLRGLVADWPAVQAGRQGAEAMVRYLAGFDPGRPVEAMFGEPAIEGRFFYNDRLDGLNFVRKSRTISSTLERMLAARERERPPAIYLQSLPVDEHLPGFGAANGLPPALDRHTGGARPRIWIGNRLTVQAHFDLKENIACQVAGRRRFTLFPPEQTPNLYPGPFEHTLAGPPVSMVRIEDPDLEAHPRFTEAREQARVAELEPGDALFIPYFWWHHVESLEPFNVLVNYWWNEADARLGSPFDVMLHALLGLRDLPAHQKAAWRVMFDHYVFGVNGDPLAHLPPEVHGTLGAHDERDRQRVRMILLETLARQAGLKAS